MHNEILEKYVEDPNVLYIYEIGLQIYGLFEDVEDRDFLIIVNNDVDNTSENFKFLNVKDWFDCVLNNSLLAWKCACLPKKYIHKEHVKLILQTNPLQLRKGFDALYKKTFNEIIELGDNTLTIQKKLFELLEYLFLANQIIENHKIVNFKVLNPIYKLMVDGTVSDLSVIKETYNKLSESELKAFKDKTDSILRASKIKKIIQSEK